MKKIPRVLGFPLTEIGGTYHADDHFIVSVGPSHVPKPGCVYKRGWHARVSIYVGGGRGLGDEVVVEHRAVTRRAAVAGLIRKVGFAVTGFEVLGKRLRESKP